VDALTYQTVKSLYLEARALEPAQRAAFLAQRCAGRAGLQSEVESLLAQDETLGEFLERPAARDFDVPAQSEPASHPEHIGAYRILKPLGFGGMGVVYLAEQESPRRSVALKLLRFDSASPRQLERFEREAELLGRLTHPGIARVYEAGWAETETGRRPFFAMEYVEGRALVDYANERGLERAARLELVCRVAEAVHYAHERGIVHRDLKPSNVLIDARGEPRVLDFGVARPLGEDSRATQTGQLVGTLSYMAPEQAVGNASVDARSDVYSLGVILYELLTGRLPLPTEGLALHEAVRRVREEEPIPAGSIRRELKGDLETVLGKALAKEPERRYATAAELAEDLRLYLEHRPVRARRPTSVYVGWKLVRRHRMLAATVAALFLALSGTQYGWLVLRQGERESERVRESADFFQEVVVRQRLLDELEGLQAEGERILEVRPSAPERLEQWLASVALASARLEDYRALLVQARAWSTRVERVPIATPEQKEYAVSILNEIVEHIESMNGPRGPVPLIRARLEQLLAAPRPEDGG
jgi:non-specific serine/threonine protein kinase/serine/threonine-protein kinase